MLGNVYTFVFDMEDIREMFTQVEYFTPNARFSEANFAHITSIGFALSSSLFSITPQQLCKALTC